MSMNNIIEIILSDDDSDDELSDSSSVVEIGCVLAPGKTDEKLNQIKSTSISYGLSSLDQIKITNIESLSGRENDHCWTDQKPLMQPEVPSLPGNPFLNQFLVLKQEVAAGQQNDVLPKEELHEIPEESDNQSGLPSSSSPPNLEFTVGPQFHKIHQCMQCDFATNRINSFRYHIKAHKSDNIVKCPACPFITDKKNRYRMHYQIKHNNIERPFQCQDCNFSTYLLAVLEKHVKVHTGNYIYRCDFCHYATNIKSYLESHVRNHYTPTQYPCSECEFSALSAIEIKKHFMDNHHSIKTTN